MLGWQSAGSGGNQRSDSLLESLNFESIVVSADEWEDHEAENRSRIGEVFVISRSSWKPGSTSGPAKPLASGMAQRIDAGMDLSPSIQLRIGMSKDRWEPVHFRRSDAWVGFEKMRGFLSYGRPGILMVAGDYRINHGYRLASGSRMIRTMSATGVLRQPSVLSRVSGYAGLSGVPVRRGVLAQYRGVVSGSVFVSRVRVPAGSSSENDISLTSAFTSESSIARRNQLTVRSYGLAVSIDKERMQVAVFVERIVLARRETGSRLAERTILSLAQSFSSGPFRVVYEIRTSDFHQTDVRSSIHSSLGSAGRLIIDSTLLNGPEGSVFGSDTRFIRSFTRRRAFTIAWLHDPSRWLRVSAGLMTERTRPDPTLFPHFDHGVFVGARSRFNGNIVLKATISARGSEEPLLSTQRQKSVRARLTATYTPDSRTSISLEIQSHSKSSSISQSGESLLVKTAVTRTFTRFSLASGIVVVHNEGQKAPVYFSEQVVSGAFPVVSRSDSGAQHSFRVRTETMGPWQFEAAYSTGSAVGSNQKRKTATVLLSYSARAR